MEQVLRFASGSAYKSWQPVGIWRYWLSAYMMPNIVKREGSEEIRQAEGIKIELKTSFVFGPLMSQGSC